MGGGAVAVAGFHRLGGAAAIYRAYLPPAPGAATGAPPAPAGPAPADTGALRRYRFVARGAETPDRNRVVIRLAGLDLANYGRNGVVLYGHEPLWPVGTAAAALRAGRLLAEVVLAPTGTSPLADGAAALVAAGVLRGLSVGVRMLRTKLGDDGRTLDVLRSELVELSLVSVPADPTALRVV